MDILQNFGVNWIQLLENMLNFGILVVLLYIFAYKPVFNVLEKRRQIIEKALNDSKEIESQKLDMKAEYKKALQEANKEAKAIVQNAIDQSSVLTQKINEDAKKDAENILSKAREEIALERGKMYEGIKQDVLTLMSSTLEKVLKNTLTEEEQKKILNKALNEIKL